MVKGNQADVVGHERLGQCVGDPLEELLTIKAGAVNSLLVELVLVHESSHCALVTFLFVIFPIENSVDHDRKRGEDHVVELVDEGFVEGLSSEGRLEAEEELGGDVEEVFVECIEHKERVSSVSFSSMNEQQWLQELELTNSIIGTSGSLLAFLS